MKRTALVAGGAGFIGSHLCDRLLAEGYHVAAVDNLSTGSPTNLTQNLNRPDFVLINHDLNTPIPTTILEVHGVPPLDEVYHFASPASPVHYSRLSIETLLVNSVGTLHLLELARRSSARFMLASTSEVYGDPQVHPQPETYWGNVNPNGPRSCYDEGKRYGEALTFTYRKRYGIDARVIRIFNTYGPRMQLDDGRVVPNFILQALSGEPLTVYGDGSQTRSFVYVADEVDGIFRAMTMPGTDGEVINLGNPIEYSVLDFAEVVCELVGVPLRFEREALPVDDPTRRRPDITRARELLRWEPSTSLQQGLRATISYLAAKIAHKTAG